MLLLALNGQPPVHQHHATVPQPSSEHQSHHQHSTDSEGAGLSVVGWLAYAFFSHHHSHHHPIDSDPSLDKAAPTDVRLSTLSEQLESLLNWAMSTLSHVLNGYATAVCVLTGTVLNLFTIYIFVRSGRRGGTPAIQYYLITLTIWQTALLVNAFCLYSLPHLLYGRLVDRGEYVTLYPMAYTLSNVTHTGSVWVVLALTIDRYLALCQPLKHRAIGKRSRVKRLMLVVSICACLFSLPRFFEVTVTYPCDGELDPASGGPMPELEEGDCEPIIERTALFDNRLYWTAYHMIAAILFVTLCPCLLILVLTLKISVALRSAIHRRRAMCTPRQQPKTSSVVLSSGPSNTISNMSTPFVQQTSIDVIERRSGGSYCSTSTRKEHKSNVMLVVVIAKFLMSDILPTLVDVIEHIVGKYTFMTSPSASLLVDISNFLLVLNCSTNFLVFVIWGRRFRHCCNQVVFSTCLGRAVYRALHLGTPPPSSLAYCASTSTTCRPMSRVGGSTTTPIRRMHHHPAATTSGATTQQLITYGTNGGRFMKQNSCEAQRGVQWNDQNDFDQVAILVQLEEQRNRTPSVDRPGR